jgi:hypothetical protein
MANDIVYILKNSNGETDNAHQIGVGECIEFYLAGTSCQVQLSAGPSSTDPANLPHTDDWVYNLPPNKFDPLNSVFRFYFDTAGTITYRINPGGQGVPGGPHTVIVGSVGLEGR